MTSEKCFVLRLQRDEITRRRGSEGQNDSLAYDVLGHLGDLAPLVFREVKAARHDFLPHVLWDGAAVVLGVEGGVAAQHHVDDHAERPQVTALQNELWKRSIRLKRDVLGRSPNPQKNVGKGMKTARQKPGRNLDFSDMPNLMDLLLMCEAGLYPTFPVLSTHRLESAS